MNKNTAQPRAKKRVFADKAPKVRKGSLIRLENMRQLCVSPKVVH